MGESKQHQHHHQHQLGTMHGATDTAPGQLRITRRRHPRVGCRVRLPRVVAKTGQKGQSMILFSKLVLQPLKMCRNQSQSTNLHEENPSKQTTQLNPWIVRPTQSLRRRDSVQTPQAGHQSQTTLKLVHVRCLGTSIPRYFFQSRTSKSNQITFKVGTREVHEDLQPQVQSSKAGHQSQTRSP